MARPTAGALITRSGNQISPSTLRRRPYHRHRGGYHGSRYSALAARRSDPDHHPACAAVALMMSDMVVVVDASGSGPSPAIMPAARAPAALAWRAVVGGALVAVAATLVL